MDDEDAIVATVKDYWEGWFAGDTLRTERALHPALTKVGADGAQISAAMTAADMIGWTRDGEGVAEKPADFAYDVTVHEVCQRIATVTVRSAIYREYLHLVKTATGWKILNALYVRV
ncbi:nuclear transport factor 2 family protein [Catellatospora citrea]|uniref:nuclear transport factor 2 family protein n=1 Tax=Catellatospora citrea TaxID=53366 RepID=UPI0034092632